LELDIKMNYIKALMFKHQGFFFKQTSQLNVYIIFKVLLFNPFLRIYLPIKIRTLMSKRYDF